MQAVQQRVAVVSGGNRGIGLAVAKQLAQRGMHVVIGARDTAKAEPAVDEIRARNLSASCQTLDVTDDASVRAFADHIRQTFGRLDVLVNNAGVALDKWVPTLDVEVAVFQRTLDVNVTGALRVMQALVPLMREAGFGRVVNLSSHLASLQDMAGLSAGYRASKVALNALTRVLAAECVDDGVLVNSVCPGWVRTELGGEQAPSTPEQAAEAVVWLATLPEGGPTGGFFKDDQQPLAW